MASRPLRNLFPRITSFSNLLAAARRAQYGKRYRGDVLAFNANLEGQLFRLQRELRDHTYTPGAYRRFHIRDPKPRVISAAPYRDRVVHHALCAVIGPPLERQVLATSVLPQKYAGIVSESFQKWSQQLQSMRMELYSYCSWQQTFLFLLPAL